MTDRLERAKQYLAIAESQDSKREAYTKAADEIIAAQKEHREATGKELSFRAIAKVVGCSDRSVGELVRWRTSAKYSSHATPWAGQTDKVHRTVTKNYLAANGSDEDVEEVVRALPAERQAKIAEAVLTSPGVARKALANPKVAATVANERMRQDVEARERVRAANPDMIGRRDNARASQQVTDRVYRAANEIALALKEIADAEISSSQCELMLVAIGDAELRLGWLRSFLETGDRSFSEALSKLLETA